MRDEARNGGRARRVTALGPASVSRERLNVGFSSDAADSGMGVGEWREFCDFLGMGGIGFGS